MWFGMFRYVEYISLVHPNTHYRISLFLEPHFSRKSRILSAINDDRRKIKMHGIDQVGFCNHFELFAIVITNRFNFSRRYPLK